MEADPKLDAMVAEKVMGWKSWHDLEWQDADGRFVASQVDYYAEDSAAIERARWSPSIDIAAAWQVVERLVSDGRHVEIECIPDYQYECYIDNQPAKDGYSGYAPTAPLSICLAALKAIGVETDT